MCVPSKCYAEGLAGGRRVPSRLRLQRYAEMERFPMIKASRFVYGFAGVLSTALVASCGGQSSTPQLPASPRTLNQLSKPAEISHTRGGTFSASHSGTFTLGGPCSSIRREYFNFSGTGRASFLRESSEIGSVQMVEPCRSWSGSVTMTSIHRRSNSITMTLGSQRTFAPCTSVPFSFTVTGGSGRFAHASGSGTVSFDCDTLYVYTDQWTGTITF